jgi:hypothetical protein
VAVSFFTAIDMLRRMDARVQQRASIKGLSIKAAEAT